MIEKIVLKARLKGKLSSLPEIFADAGFSRVEEGPDFLLVEKTQGEDLKGNVVIDYRFIFKKDRIELIFSLSPKENKYKRLIELFPLFLNVLIVAEDVYDIKLSDVLVHVKKALSYLSESMEKDVVELNSELSLLRRDYEDLKSKYEDLVRSSEENSRILIECERKRDELKARLEKVLGMSDELLKEELFSWIKLHNGSIDVTEFSRHYNIHPSRVEEGLNMLIREGYIRRKK